MLCVLSACESSAYLSAEQRLARTDPAHDQFAAVGYAVQWRTASIMPAGERVGFFDPLGDLVVVQNTSGGITAIEDDSGITRWADRPAGPLTRYVGNVRWRNFIAVSSEAELFLYDASTGDIIERHNLAEVVNTRPIVAGDVLVYGTATGQILGHQAALDLRAWPVRISGPVVVDPVRTGSATACVSDTGSVVIIDSDSGRSLGRNKLFDGIDAPPGASDQAVFIASRDQSLYALSSFNASLLWRIRTEAPLTLSPWYHDGRVYCWLPDRGLCGIAAANGSILWNNQSVKGTPIGIRDGTLLVWSEPTLWALDLRDGEIVEQVDIPRVEFVRMVGSVDGPLYTCTPDGVIAKLAPR